MKRWLLALFLAAWLPAATAQQMPEITLSVGEHKLVTEVAANDAQRMQGLMYRRMLPENRGMLFVFTSVALHGMWMMNTYLPLSVAFLDERGVIINIEDMQPQTTTSHMAARPARYALETNLGWFKKRGIKPGDRIEGIERAPAPR